MSILTRPHKVSDEQIQTAKSVDLLALAEQHTQLRKNAHHDWMGPCPKCGGDNRFHVYQNGGAWRWRCYQCHREPGDPIEFITWLRNLSFPDAVAALLDLPALPAPAAPRRPAPQTPAAPAADFATRYKGKLRAAAERLQRDAAGQPGRDYLIGRGLHPETWQAFRLGYAPNVKVPESDEDAPAIAIPWYDAGGNLVAIRYRFLQAHGATKITSAKGSVTSGRLFGWQALPEGCTDPLPADHTPVERKFTLLICEGELNALSCWQAAQDTRLDVLSIGSESSHLSDETIAYAGRYATVLLWTDKADIARQLATCLPNVHPVASPGWEDANDLHKQGQLAGFLAFWRTNITQDDKQRTALYWDLWDGAHYHGIDGAAALAVNALGAKLGRPALAGGAV